VNSGPPKHLGTAVQQLVNFLGIMQNEWAGAQALNGFDTYLAPFIKKDGLSYDEVKQCIQYFVYGVNTPSRWGCFDLDTQIEVKLDIIEIETDKGIIRCFKNKKLATLNRGLVYANELTEEDELDETNPQLLAMLITK
jgi:anaerobic ribonucleoside-triphosphate reductase